MKTPALSGGSGKLKAISPFVKPCARIKQGLATAILRKGEYEWIKTV
jgi:hypothetical protein